MVRLACVTSFRDQGKERISSFFNKQGEYVYRQVLPISYCAQQCQRRIPFSTYQLRGRCRKRNKKEEENVRSLLMVILNKSGLCVAREVDGINVTLALHSLIGLRQWIGREKPWGIFQKTAKKISCLLGGCLHRLGYTLKKNVYVLSQHSWQQIISSFSHSPPLKERIRYYFFLRNGKLMVGGTRGMQDALLRTGNQRTLRR